METIQISFIELRKITQQVISFIKQEYWWESDSNLATSLEADLGITGADAEELLNSFSKLFNSDLSQLEFDKYFDYEGKINNNPISWILQPLGAIFLILVFLIFILQYLLYLIIRPFSKIYSQKIFDFSLTTEWGLYSRKRWPNKTPERTFNVGDLVASAVAGRFVKREHVQFQLI